MRVGLFLAAFVFAVMAMLTTMPARAADGCLPPAGYMRSIQGQVEIRRGAADWRPAVLEEPLCAGDLIRVGERSRALAAIANLTKRIDQNTTLSLTYVPEDKPSVVGLLEGAVYFFSRKPRVLEVDTPFFDAAVEGTEFLVRVEPQRAVLTVFDGRITARNDQGELTVANGESLTAEAGQAPTPSVPVRPRDAVQWALFYPIILLPLADRSGAAARAGPLGAAVELAARGEYTAAFAAFENIPDADRGAEFHLYRAATLLSVGRVEDARADIDQALARDPAGGRAYALSAVIAVVQNERERAITDGERGVELSPRSAAARIALSYAEQARFRIEAAREGMQQAVQDEPENALAWARLSELWLMQGYRGRALKAAKTARKLAPELERTQTVLGFAALAAIDIGGAKQAFSRAIALNSADPQARFGLGLATIRGGALERGRGQIELAVGLDPDNSLLRSYLGKAYFDSRITNPLTYFEQLVTNFPNQENTLAAEQYAIAKRLDPQDPTPWLYDAIRKQSENRPVEALRDIETSIELNDNRAVYRSRELLDQDRASRGTSLARIYNDLGFEQLGINEATKSLSLDPANAGAHRFLSDVYLTQPRREIARVSELLQAQLLQDININPVQPSLGETNLGIITGGGPARPGFNEFTPLFERNQAQLNLSGVVGNQGTYGDEAVVSGIYDQFSVSAGQFYYQTDGFRENTHVQQDIGDFFMQAAVTPKLNVQTEVNVRRSEYGDLFQPYNSSDTQKTLQHDLDQDIARIGVRIEPEPESTVLGSVIYGRRHLKTSLPLSDEFGTTLIEGRLKYQGIQGEGAYLYNANRVNGQVGLGIYDIDNKIRGIFDSNITEMPQFSQHVDNTEKFDTKHYSSYMYANINLPEPFIWTLGLSHDDYNGPDRDTSKINPKLGVQWFPLDQLRLRFAAFRTVKPPFVADRTIQPTQVAGFNQFFDDTNETEAWVYGAGADFALTDDATLGLELAKRTYDEPTSQQPETTNSARDSRREYLARTYLYWTPHPEWALRGEVDFDRFRSNPKTDTAIPESVTTWSTPLSVRYFSPTGILADLTGTFVSQDVRNDNNIGDGNNGAFVLDAAIGYRFPERRGLISLQGLNLFDTNLRYQGDGYREFRDAFGNPQEISSARFLPERTIFTRMTLNF